MVTRSRVGTSEHRQEAKSGECREEGKRDERPKGSVIGLRGDFGDPGSHPPTQLGARTSDSSPSERAARLPGARSPSPRRALRWGPGVLPRRAGPLLHSGGAKLREPIRHDVRISSATGKFRTVGAHPASINRVLASYTAADSPRPCWLFGIVPSEYHPGSRCSITARARSATYPVSHEQRAHRCEATSHHGALQLQRDLLASESGRRHHRSNPRTQAASRVGERRGGGANHHGR